jgi:hypothetical protein
VAHIVQAENVLAALNCPATQFDGGAVVVGAVVVPTVAVTNQ